METSVDANEVIQVLVRRIATLELEKATLQVALAQQKEGVKDGDTSK